MSLDESRTTHNQLVEQAAKRLEEALLTLQDHWPNTGKEELETSFEQVHSHLRKIYQRIMENLRAVNEFIEKMESNEIENKEK